MISVILFIVVVLIAAIYLLVEFKRLRHKLFAFFLIGVILFIYLSAFVALRGHDIDYKTIPGVIEATKIYWTWLGSAFGNVKSITTNAIKMNWGSNSTAG